MIKFVTQTKQKNNEKNGLPGRGPVGNRSPGIYRFV